MVAICTERVEAKIRRKGESRRDYLVAICTERVEAKFHKGFHFLAVYRCNLHGACGGKERVGVCFALHKRVAICTERVEAKVAGKENFCKENVAICTERVEAK